MAISPEDIEAKIIVIDTEQSAGNFERLMCAYITGEIGDCEVGDHIAAKYGSEIHSREWWKKHIVRAPDDKDCYRPTSIHITPGWFNHGMGKCYPDGFDEAVALQERNRAHQDYYGKWIARDRQRLEAYDTGIDRSFSRDTVEQSLKRHEDTLAARLSEPFKRHGAYLSVAIFVDEFPPADVLDELIERAEAFGRDPAGVAGWEYLEPITVTGFRKIDPGIKFEEAFTSTSVPSLKR
jgi:hypothetical protein